MKHIIVLLIACTCVSLHASEVPNGPIWFNPIASVDQIKDELEARKFDINMRNDFGMTGLMTVARQGVWPSYQKAQLLIAYGADVNARTTIPDDKGVMGFTALHFAAQAGDEQIESENVAEEPRSIINLLVDNGADVNAVNSNGDAAIMFIMDIQNNDDPSLFVHASDKRFRALRALMNNHADINNQNKQGNTMLHRTADINDIAWLQRIKGAYGQLLNFNLINNVGLTPEGYAKAVGHQAMFDELSHHPVLLGADGNVDARDDQGKDGLMLAVERTDVGFAGDQIHRGAHVNAQDKDGNTALHLAFWIRPKGPVSPMDFIRLLCQQPSIKVTIANNKGETPLHLVPLLESPADRIEAATILLHKGADILAPNKQGKTVLHLAVEKNDIALINYLKEKINDILHSATGNSPQNEAFKRKLQEAEFILEKK